MLLVLLRYTFNSSVLFNQIAPGHLSLCHDVPDHVGYGRYLERTTTTLEALDDHAYQEARSVTRVCHRLRTGGCQVQVGLASLVALTWLGLSVSGSVLLLLLIALLDALLGMALGIFVSAFATTDFQAVQFMPAIASCRRYCCAGSS